MAVDVGLLGASDSATSKNKLTFVGCIARVLVVSVVIAVVLSSHSGSSSTATSGAVALLVSASPFVGANARFRQSAPRGNVVGDSPLARLAIAAIEATSRGGQTRDASAKAQNALIAGWTFVDTRTQERLVKVLDDVKFKSSALAGITAPLGFFDPLGFCTTVTAGKLLFYREVELKHGRVAMLASLGIFMGEQFRPLFGNNIDVPSISALQETPLETFWLAVVTAIAIPEVLSVPAFQNPFEGGELWAIREGHEPGNMGFDPLGLKPTDPREMIEMQSKELNNGRLAMIGVAGMIAQELATGKKIF